MSSFLHIYLPCNQCSNGIILSKDSTAIKCSCRVEYEKELRFLYQLQSSNLLQEKSSKEYYLFLRDYDISFYKGPDEQKNLPKIKKFIEEFDTRYSSFNLFLTGSPGTQKTTLAKFILCSLLRRKKTGYYILVNDYIKLAEESNRNEEKKELLEYINTVDILILDECDQEKLIMYHSNWKESNLFPQIKYRLESIKKSTIFCSNKTVDNLGEKFKGAIQNLIERETIGGSLFFEDIYVLHREKLDLSKIWE